MIADIRTLSHDAPMEADVCIIGGGAAGIALARDLLSSPFKVVLLESGGYRREDHVQRLGSADSIGEKYFQELHECRSRRFGGSTNCWGGICTPLHAIDYEKRPWVPWSGWPIAGAQLEPYLRRAHDICGVGPFLYDARAWERMGIPFGEIPPDRFQRFVWHYNGRGSASLRFGKRFREELRRAPNVHIFLHANATELLTGASGRSVERVMVRTLDRRTIQVRAKMFVLACGAIENARLLLSSTSRHSGGLGNHRDLVGRFFHEHLHMPCGLLLAPDRGGLAARYSRLSKLGGAFGLPGLSLAPEAQVAHRTLNGSLAIDPFYDPDGAWMAFQRLRSGCKTGKVNLQTLGQLYRVVRESRQLAPEIWRRLVHKDRPRGDSRRFVIYARAEQAPNPDSRVVLSSEVDALGMRQARLDWRTTPMDRKAIRLMASLAAEEFPRLGWGHVIESPWLSGESWPPDLEGGPHHMGTTRMSEDDSSGVVDRNCRVHGLHGLYVAGSSVFPTGGHANPTLTIIALALRLAEHLRIILADPIASLVSEESAARLPEHSRAQVMN